MPMTFSAQRIWKQMAPRIREAVNITALEATELAKDRAPVRKVFRGSVGRAGLQTDTEAKAEAHLRKQVGLAAGPVRTQRSPGSKVHSVMAYRALSRGKLIFAPAPLTTRGRYELRSGRSVFRSSGGKTTLGGRLKGEIHAIPAEGEGPRWVARVVSPTPYAKYVEFGTRHNRAQPYLRPTLEQVRESFRARCVAAVQIGRAA